MLIIVEYYDSRRRFKREKIKFKDFVKKALNSVIQQLKSIYFINEEHAFTLMQFHYALQIDVYRELFILPPLDGKKVSIKFYFLAHLYKRFEMIQKILREFLPQELFKIEINRFTWTIYINFRLNRDAWSKILRA